MSDFTRYVSADWQAGTDTLLNPRLLLIDSAFGQHKDAKSLLSDARAALRGDPVIRRSHIHDKRVVYDDSVILSSTEIAAATAFFRKPHPAWTPATSGFATVVKRGTAQASYRRIMAWQNEVDADPPPGYRHIKTIACAAPFFFRERSLAMFLWTEISPDISQTQLLLFRYENGTWRVVDSIYGIDNVGGTSYLR